MMTSAAIAPIFSSMKALCTLLPARAPRQLMPVNIISATAAMTLSFQATPVSARKYEAKITATAAMPPVCVTRSSPHPYTNATAGWYASRK